METKLRKVLRNYLSYSCQQSASVISNETVTKVWENIKSLLKTLEFMWEHEDQLHLLLTYCYKSQRRVEFWVYRWLLSHYLLHCLALKPLTCHFRFFLYRTFISDVGCGPTFWSPLSFSALSCFERSSYSWYTNDTNNRKHLFTRLSNLPLVENFFIPVEPLKDRVIPLMPAYKHKRIRRIDLHTISFRSWFRVEPPLRMLYLRSFPTLPLPNSCKTLYVLLSQLLNEVLNLIKGLWELFE